MYFKTIENQKIFSKRTELKNDEARVQRPFLNMQREIRIIIQF